MHTYIYTTNTFLCNHTYTHTHTHTHTHTPTLTFTHTHIDRERAGFTSHVGPHRYIFPAATHCNTLRHTATHCQDTASHVGDGDQEEHINIFTHIHRHTF